MIFFLQNPEVHQTIIHGDDAPYFNNVDQLSVIYMYGALFN